ncbi:MAG TPA: hypothetical protein DEP47_05720 [Chloroflexi bacterium]|nr:hypothetical protein [Chloroflexota bacterium]
MKLRKIIVIFTVMLIATAGSWLIGRPNQLSPVKLQPRQPLDFSSNPQQDQETFAESDPINQDPVPGSMIDLSDLPQNLYDPDNRYLRWLRGEYKPGKGEPLVSPQEKRALQEVALDLEPGVASMIALPMSVTNMEIGTNFDSMDFTDCCGSGGFIPPDPELAVGRDHIIAVVNVAFEIYDKSGAVQIPATTFATLFNGISGCTIGTQLFDPNVIYDEEADRFILGVDGAGVNYCIAASLTSDPTGQWVRYKFPTNVGGAIFDYPHAGVGRDAIYMGGNTFVNESFSGAKVFAYDKWAMYDGLATQWRERSLVVNQHTPQPANLHGYLQGTWPESGPHYIITGSDNKGENYSVFAWNDPFGANEFYHTGTFNLVTATGVPVGFPVSVPQPTGGNIEANDWRPQDAEYRNGTIWTTNTASCNPGTGTVDCVRWAQIKPESASVIQAGVLRSNGIYRIFSDLAVNHCDDMAMGYTRTDPTDLTWGYPSIYVAGRTGSTHQNMLLVELPLKLSNVPYTAFDSPPYRWGDYTGLTSDPNGWDLWYLGQYSKETGNSDGKWGTYIGSLSFPRNSTLSPIMMTNLENSVYLPFVHNNSSGGIDCS